MINASDLVKLQGVDIDGLSKVELREMVGVIEEMERRGRLNFRSTYFPDEGPLRRELYVKHCEFFAVGAKYAERCMISANRVGKCLTYRTLIDTVNGKRSIGELYEDGKPFSVYAWDGEKSVSVMAHPPFKKGVEECMRITLSTGVIEGAFGHRI